MGAANENEISREAATQAAKELAMDSAHIPTIAGILRSRFDAAIDQATAPLREQLATHCACSHDGRGRLVSECQTHESLRTHAERMADALERAKNSCQFLLARNPHWQENAEAYQAVKGSLDLFRTDFPKKGDV